MLTTPQGESPYEDATDVLRKKMGCKRKGNHFTLHGQLHEPIALKEYKKCETRPPLPNPHRQPTLTPFQ